LYKQGETPYNDREPPMKL